MVMSKQQLAKKIFDLERQNKLPTGSYHSLVGSESNFNPTAKSPADAHGYAQIIPSTGKELGIDIHDPIQNLEGGARYLKTQGAVGKIVGGIGSIANTAATIGGMMTPAGAATKAATGLL
jgi:hypothetical protein